MANERLLSDAERRRYRLITKEVRQDCSIWDIDGLLKAQQDLTAAAKNEECKKRLLKAYSEWEAATIKAEAAMKEHYEAHYQAKLEQARQDALKEVGEWLKVRYRSTIKNPSRGIYRMTFAMEDRHLKTLCEGEKP